MKALLKKLINIVGYDISPLSHAHTMGAGLYRCKNRGVDIKTVIDVGASNGMWTKKCMEYYPNARYFLIEAQSPHESSLIRLSQKHKNVEYTISAASQRVGQIYFHAGSLLGGVASEKPFEEHCISVPATTIDYEVDKRNLNPPFLLKLDTHGHEIPILEGASEALKKSNLIIIEAYNLRFNEGSLRFHELCNYMESKGFKVLDIIDLTLRPRDLLFWQADVFFIKSDDKVFDSTSFD